MEESAFRRMSVNVQKAISACVVNSVSTMCLNISLMQIKSRRNFCHVFTLSAKCVIPCLNGGKCKGINICRCSNEYKGNHCEIATTRITSQRSTCSKPCKHGTCQPNDTCLCEAGWYGKFCHKSKPWA